MSRAAVFTGAALAATACDQGAPAVGTIKGVATWAGGNAFGNHSGLLESGTDVFLTSVDGGYRRSTKTDTRGEFQFVNVPVGAYTVQLGAKEQNGSPNPQVTVQVHDGALQRADLVLPVAMPYGAPPARRRVV